MAHQRIVDNTDLSQKAAFHRLAIQKLRALATHLSIPRGHYDLRSNKAGPAVMGEITLHADTLYTQVNDRDILVRSCTSRRDYTGGPNGFLPLRLLDDIPTLISHLVQRRLAHSPYQLRNTHNTEDLPVHQAAPRVLPHLRDRPLAPSH